MENILRYGWFFLILIVFVFVTSFLKSKLNTPASKSLYHYTRKQFFMSKPEHDCFDALQLAVGQEYYIFAQVHLPTLVEHKIKGQHWKAAFRYINQKSVDYVLCDKQYISPKLAIELDDASHERPDRQERDGIVEGILQEAGLPLLRIENHGSFDPTTLAEQIRTKLA